MNGEPPMDHEALRAPELASVRVEGMTRSAFVMRGALAAASVYGLSAVGPFVGRALAQESSSSSAGDVGIVRFALTLEMLEATFYEEALKQVRGLSGDVKEVTTELRDNEREHVETLTALLNQLGAPVGPKPEFEFGNAFSSEASYLKLSQTFEDTGVRAYNGAGPEIQQGDTLEAAGMIVQVEARHAGVIRLLRGERISPSAFDKGATIEQISREVDPFTAR